MNKRVFECVSACVSALAVSAVSVVANAAPETADDIRDIRPLILIPPWWYWLAAAIGAAVVLALVGAGVRYWRRRSRRPLTPEESAREALGRAEALARAGQCREWAELVAQTLRSALAARLGSDTCPQTTSELAATDWAQTPQGATVDGLGLVALLETCDLTRFALGRLDISALLASTASAEEWVTRLFAAPPTAASTPAPATAPEHPPISTPSNPASNAA